MYCSNIDQNGNVLFLIMYSSNCNNEISIIISNYL